MVVQLGSRHILTFSAVISATICPSLAMAASQDESIIALRREMLEMRRQMSGEIQQLKARIVRDEGPGALRSSSLASRRQQVARAAAQPAPWSGPLPVIGDVEGASHPHGPRTDAETRTALSEGPIPSWAEFKAASEQDESVHIGGMRIGFPSGRPTIASDDKAYSFSVGLLAQEDIGGFVGSGPKPGETKGNFNNLTENARRLRLYFTWRYKDWVANVTPDFGSSSVDGTVGLFEANLNYTGFRHTTLTVGYFQPRGDEESAERSGAFEFLERPTIVDLVRNIAGGVARFSIGGEHYEDRWLVAGYFTGQKFGDRSKDTTITDSQTGGVLRVAGRPYVSKDIDLYVGGSATTAFKVNESSKGRQYTFSDNTEIPLGETSLLSSGALTDVAQIWAAGPELALRWRRFLLKGQYYHVGVQRDHSGTDPLPSLGFDGWYVAANYTLFGKPRGYNSKIAAFTTPGVEKDFDPAHNHWGALELSGRWSVTDLDDVPNQGGTGINGNQQTAWEAGLNWYPNRHIRFMLDYERFIISRSTGGSNKAINVLGRDGNAVVGRIQASF